MQLGRKDLHPYQVFSIEYIKSHPIAALFLDCGLGKTVTTLTALLDLLFDEFRVHKVLVICPIRVGAVWLEEAESWEHLGLLKLSRVMGTEKERKKALQEQADIYLINRENVEWLVEKSGVPFDFDFIVIDELSSFKNAQSKRFRALMKVRPLVKRITGLTATPSTNGLMDLFAEFKCLDMGERLGKFIGRFRTAYFRPSKFNGPIVYSYEPLPGAEKQIYDKISDITISMKAVDHLKMPDLVTVNRVVQLSKEEKEKYGALKKELVLSLPEGDVTAANAAALSGKLMQMAGGAVYADDDETGFIQIHDGKLQMLEELLDSLYGQQVLVIYWFKHELTRIEERLAMMKKDYAKIDSDAAIRKWNEGKIEVGLLNPQSAGHGLNLQKGGCSNMIWFSTPYSLELVQQTIDRLYRQGQKAATVVIQHIITEGTIDEKVMKALASKDMTQSALIDAVKADLKL